MKCLENDNKCHCEGVKRPWQSQSANTVYNKESRTPLTAVGTLTALLRNSTKVMENLSQILFNFRFVQMFSAVFILSVCAIGNTWAANPSGTCGTNCNWTIENGTLKITGGTNGEIGTMDDYNYKDSTSGVIVDTPWFTYKGAFSNVDVSGVNNVGNCAFLNLGISNAKIADTVRNLGEHSLQYNSLTAIDLPESIENIQHSAFAYNDIHNVQLPDSLKELTWADFVGNGLQSIIIPDGLIMNPEALGFFYEYPELQNSNMQIICKGTQASCESLKQYLPDFDYDFQLATAEQCTGMYIWENNECHRRNAEQCNAATDENGRRKYYYDGEDCKLLPADTLKMSCVSGYHENNQICVQDTCEYYNKLSSCSESIVGCAKTVCEEDGSLADGTPCYKEVEQSIAPSCGENAHLVDNESTCACVCNSGYTGDGASCVAINCAAGEYWNGEQCAACADETYSAGGFVTECSANTAEHCASKSNTANVCASCAANYFMDGTTCTAINCSAGEFFDMSAKVCTPCVEGEWNDVAAATSCMPNTAENCATFSKTANVCASCAAKFKLADNECVMMTCAEVYPDSSETQCETTTSGCSVTTCSEVGSLANGTKCYKSATTDHTPNCDSNATLVGEGASCSCQCNTGFEGSGTTCTAISCPAGKYLDGSECKPCAAGSYAGAGDNVCSSCGAHEYSAASASSCSPRNNMSNCNSFATDTDECTSCKTGYKSENGGCVSLCSGGKVFWDGECYDEYPFAKKRYTPAEADQWLKDDGNIVTLIFKK